MKHGQKYHSILQQGKTEIWNNFRNITSGIDANYQVQIIVLIVYTIT